MRPDGKPIAGVAYSYIRFSTAEQQGGDSVSRQTELRDAWLKRHPAVTLDASLTLADMGVSGFRGRHRSDKHALRLFLKMVDAGRIPSGSLLIIENLDRLTREDELEATHLFTGLLLKGIRIVQLEPETLFDRSADQLAIMRAVLELGRGHAESARKSFLLEQAWGRKKKRAAATGEIVTGRCPAWLEVADGRFRFKPGARATLRRISQMAAAGRGSRLIAKTLNEEGVPPFGAGAWDETYLRKIFRSRAVIGW
jgi:DNA invertase Pin-like site-specific DNA recombinase